MVVGACGSTQPEKLGFFLLTRVLEFNVLPECIMSVLINHSTKFYIKSLCISHVTNPLACWPLAQVTITWPCVNVSLTTSAAEAVTGLSTALIPGLVPVH